MDPKMIYMDKIEPPVRVPLTQDEQQMKRIAEALTSEDRWVKNLIDGLAGILRSVKD
jgi:hypothetical protein